MIENLQPLRGMKDLLPNDYQIHNYIINKARDVGALYGYKQMSTPILEYTKVFNRSMGESSDVMSKEIYSFVDKSNNAVALRPEFTSGIIRSFISNGLQHKLPLKFFSTGPVFRYDRPQAGRQRQFHQLNYEYLGAKGAITDAETVKLAVDILKALEIEEDTTLELNSLGCHESRIVYQQKLVEYLNDFKDQLSGESRLRLNKNPMRILDSKSEIDQKIIAHAPILSEYHTNESKKYFDELQKYLDILGIKYSVNPRLVRGLDYYCHTVFEFTTKKLGSQSTILAGGRYDMLSRIMGNYDVHAIGFAAGIERIALMREYKISVIKPVFVLPIGKNNICYALDIVDKLRLQNIVSIIDPIGKIAKRIQRVLNEDAKFIIFIGDEEKMNNNLKFKDLKNQKEYIIDFEKVLELLKQ
ncbi:histidine--tRNA ligase [Rickettsia prowazekii]|uniref:Histidine--tRNA ligase n=2 Tax=Rickettsia prowazekii TaxID=782 RepID=SYH_RICPR|nr:histidine--tRNA ligase [Rickettsia prowazekii]Q9ZDL9.2 RecName: Full=Histidine--tRNA ligase; AltName: Full=Histidyl-tRNA synthetase; Short=HisRS [Rickettsia prowazekii str. Madrid E]EOB09664.1 Histidine--tRNA ligase [Rickettsia prowazekii str. GvF12]ADE29823.1 Histidyl-tRNA synthetase [Rickettsia prowazekii str. Rp22]AFE49125.1 histidyl-tRNA synthetase [Rickettsia prowazekii str. Chernikova]AFE49971.1 histidyl-tRNA synthetase [Rickettsia prowazekii str. Katsinyian]AFE50815.1 histidyl-tRNA 